MRKILKKAKRKTEEIKTEFMVDEVKNGFQRWRETTSTSPSGIHLGHYKSILKRDGTGKEETEEYNYSGQFQGDTMHGKGKISYKKFGDSYEGEFKKGLIEGEGVYTWKNKEIFKGQFLKGKLQGSIEVRYKKRFSRHSSFRK